jgi:5'-3' exonuclease
LEHYGHIEQIPEDSADWEVTVRGAKALAASLAEHREAALLYRQLATLRLDVPLPEDLAQLEWQGVRREFTQGATGEVLRRRDQLLDNLVKGSF